MLTSVRILQDKFKTLIPGDYQYYLDTTKFILPDHSDFDVEFLYHRTRDDLVIFDLSDEPWRETMAERLNELCVRHKFEKHLILSHSLKYYRNHSIPNIIYFPHNYFDPIFAWDENVGLKNVDQFKRDYFVSCLNRQPRIPRIYNYLKLTKKSYVNDLLLSIHNLSDQSVYTCINDLYQNEWLEQWMLDEWEQDFKPFAPTECVNDLDVGHDSYHNAYINLVTETFVQPFELFFTEKVYKPLASGQLFMISGPTGSVATLRNMGFDTFDDIIEHSRYDYISDWKQRIDMIHTILDELHELGWEQIYKDTYLRRLSNARHFYSGLAVRPYMNDLTERMSGLDGVQYTYDHHQILKMHNLRSPLYSGLYPINHLFN